MQQLMEAALSSPFTNPQKCARLVAEQYQARQRPDSNDVAKTNSSESLNLRPNTLFCGFWAKTGLAQKHTLTGMIRK